MSHNPFSEHRKKTKALANSLSWPDVYHWLVEYGYYPESYVLPPCFKVSKRPVRPFLYSRIKGTQFSPRPTPSRCYSVQFPKTELTDRVFGILHPKIHNDIAYYIARNWRKVVDKLIPENSNVACYSFPVPIDSKHLGRMGHVRSGRMIYEFIWMTEEDLASEAYRYTHILRADIRNFYPSIYTHSISWAFHGKNSIRKKGNRFDLSHLGNRLDKLFQLANDEKTHGIPIGPAVSDIVAEIIAAGVDKELTRLLRNESIQCEMARFKDDYRILVKSEDDGRRVLKHLQAALKHYELEIADDKTSIVELPDGLYRPWVSAYHAAFPHKREHFRWKDFKELYLAVLRIDKDYPGTGVIDRFLADIVSEKRKLRVDLTARNLRKAMSMLLMLGNRRIKSFPKILAIIESIYRSPFGGAQSAAIMTYLGSYLERLSDEESRNTYLISWITYFFRSNGIKFTQVRKPKFKHPITQTVYNNRAKIFREVRDFQLFEGCRRCGKAHSMLEYLDPFHPPKQI